MSTARADTFSDRAGTGSPAITGGELSRSRFNLNGVGVIAGRDSFNISSYVDNGTGDYSANFSVAFPAFTYSAIPQVRSSSTVLIALPAMDLSSVNIQRTYSSNTSGIVTDAEYMMAATFGDKP